ncbi:Chorismate pyruvate-lyase [BD1-7 clade bacterium]|uniref:Probable chorismate pyruvate-lyase n=1 Tax=BD1-7 clade bacterium TaxID=2029982 RepID=A0A5S9N2B0_9GAMM|nr:Chorismate pyruvate-lyase [BD1-7 clade bacterium]CAA0082944.1 Chorismate pyruvate-lyase [BD1-7 clade bacterium]
MFNSLGWYDQRQFSLQQLPASVRPWLLDTSSLTARLVAASHGNFRVQVLRQSWRLPTQNEAQALGIPPRQHALIREVLLLCHDTPWVYARSVIPAASFTGRLRFLRRLQDSALGALLFKAPNLSRSRFDIAVIRKHNQPSALHRVTNGATVYGRRSLFHIYGKQLLVAEIFLPACELGQLPPSR